MKPQLTFLAVVGLLLVTGRADAYDPIIPLESPDYFVQAVGGWVYGEIDSTTDQIGTQQLTLVGSTQRDWLAGGSATLPIVASLGTRFGVDGGSSSQTINKVKTELGGVTGSAELFWRNPTRGEVAIGYAYTWTTPRTPATTQSGHAHSLPIHASLYMPSFEGNTVDWNVAFRYDWIDVDTATGSVDRWAYEFVGSSRWYVDRWASFEGGVRFQQMIQAQHANVVEGVFELELLLPGGARHFGTFSLLGSVGRRLQQDLPPPFYSVSQLTWQVGFGATVFFPGVTSLVELHRAYR